MKRLFFTLALLACSPAAAQWQVPNNTIPIGRGPGVTGFNSAANTGTGSLCFMNTIPPAFGTCPGGISGPGSAVVGNIAYWANVGATSLGATPVFQSGNPGQAALYSPLASPAAGSGTFNAMQVGVGTPLTAADMPSPTGRLSQGIVGTNVIAAGDMAISAYGVTGFAISNSTLNSNAVGVGGWGFCNGAAGTSSCWGAAFVAQNAVPSAAVGLDSNSIIGTEIDIGIRKKSGAVEPTVSHLQGLLVTGGGDSTVNQGTGVEVDRLSVVTSAKWATGFSSDPGASQIAFLAGPTARTGNSLASQPTYWQGVNSSGTTVTAQASADSSGDLLFQSASTANVSLGDGNGNYVVTVPTVGGAKVRFPATVGSPGMIINDTSGNLNTAPISASAQTALAINVGTAGALLVNGGALGSPSSGTLTTGTTIFGQNVTWSGGIPATVLTGTLAGAQFPILTGDITTAGGSLATTLATVNSNTGPFGSATQCVTVTNNAKGLTTAVSAVTCTPAIGSITGVGTGFVTAAVVNVGTAGSFVVNGGALGSPSSAGTIPAFTLGGTIAGGGNQINNVVIGAITPLAASHTTITLSNGSANGLRFNASGGTADAQMYEGAGGTLINILGSTNTWQLFTNGAGALIQDYNATNANALTLTAPTSAASSFSVNGDFITATGSPTIASGACGTGTNGTISGDNQSGVITIGAIATTSCAISFSKTLTAAPKACLFSPGNATAAGATVLAHLDTFSATGFTLSGSVLASAKFNYHCY